MTGGSLSSTRASAFFSVARFRDVVFAQMLYAGDDVSAEEWDHRD